jgi:hypothetical protein
MPLTADEHRSLSSTLKHTAPAYDQITALTLLSTTASTSTSKLTAFLSKPDYLYRSDFLYK